MFRLRVTFQSGVALLIFMAVSKTLMTDGRTLTTIPFTLSRGDRGYESRGSKSDSR